MSNEVLLACVGALLSLVGAVAWRLWDGQATSVKALEERLRKLETEGGEPMRQLKSELAKLDERIEKLDDRIEKLTNSIISLMGELRQLTGEHHKMHGGFGNPMTGG